MAGHLFAGVSTCRMKEFHLPRFPLAVMLIALRRIKAADPMHLSADPPLVLLSG